MTDDRTWFTNDQNLTYRFNNGIPNQLTESISPWMNNARAAWDGCSCRHNSTHDRFTLQGALRFDRAVSWFPEQREGPRGFSLTPSSSRQRAASTVTRISRRELGSSTTYRARPRRRSRHTWAGTSKARGR
jgi:hypothetical protein